MIAWTFDESACLEIVPGTGVAGSLRILKVEGQGLGFRGLGFWGFRVLGV